MLVNLKDRVKPWRRRLKSIGARIEAKLLPQSWAIGVGKQSKNSNYIRSNLDVWKKLQSEDYFEKHPCYKGISDYRGEEAVEAIRWFLPLRTNMKLAVIGCGYGRESLKLAPHVGHVYGIDVSDRILNKAVGYLSERGIKNFTPVLAESFVQTMPSDLDVVFSIIVMQHLLATSSATTSSNLGASWCRAEASSSNFWMSLAWTIEGPMRQNIAEASPQLAGRHGNSSNYRARPG